MNSRIALIISVVIALCVGVYAQPRQWSPHMGLPPTGIVSPTPAYAKLQYADSTRALVWFEMVHKKVTFQWRRDSPDVSRFQMIATSYWPTAVSALASGNELLVAGKRRNGATVIERWKIAKPVTLNPTVGTLDLSDATVTEVEAIYDEATQGRDMVWRMLVKPNQSTSVLVQFFDSRSLYDIKWTPTSTTALLVASPATLPALQTSFTFSWVKDHKTRGYVYVFRDEDAANSTTVLIDQDRNGTIDSAVGVSDADWISGDWGEGSSYN